MANTAADRCKGLDMGTSTIVLATMEGEQPVYKRQLNAFVSLPFSSITESTLEDEQILHVAEGSKLLAYGNRSDEFGNIVGGATRRPMHTGLLNPDEPQNLDIIRLIVEHLCGPAKKGDRICFSAPSSPDGTGGDLVYHEESVRDVLEALGYEATVVNEAQAVVFAELQDSDFTGFGMSFGGGLCNACFSYLGVPVLSFCILMGGDYIDQHAAAAIGETPTTVRLHKESDQFVLNGRSSSRMDRALTIYYRHVVKALAGKLAEELAGTRRMPSVVTSAPVIFAGGTAEVKGFQAMLKAAITEVDLPIQISDVRKARSGRNATAKGALLAAMLNG